jgi:choline dehydrogenase-like flavoprotein
VRSYEYVIVGSGPSAVAAAQEIAGHGKKVLVLDSSTPEDDARVARESLADSLKQSGNYSLFDEAYSGLIKDDTSSLVKKKFGQTVSRKKQEHHNQNFYVSNIKGGFSEVWGSVILPAPPEVTNKYPFVDDLNSYQAKVLNELPKFGNSLPISQFAPDVPIQPFKNLQLSELQQRIPAEDASPYLVFPSILSISTEGVTSCINCSKCLTGCPAGAIWSAGKKIDQLGVLIEYRQNSFVKSFKEEEKEVSVTYMDLTQNLELQIRAKVLLLGAGVCGTAEILLNSKVNRSRIKGKDSTVVQAIHLTKPLKRHTRTKTLSEVTILNKLDDAEYEYCQIYRLTKNALDLLQLKNSFFCSLARLVTPLLERILVISFTYFPHSESASFEILEQGEVFFHSKTKAFTLRHYIKRIRALAPIMLKMKILPIPIFFIFKDKGEGMHFSSTFPFSEKEEIGNYSNAAGNPCTTKRIFLIDASNLIEPIQGPPTLFVMANARRIANLAVVTYG